MLLSTEMNLYLFVISINAFLIFSSLIFMLMHPQKNGLGLLVCLVAVNSRLEKSPGSRLLKTSQSLACAR